MICIAERQDDILKLISQLDISPTMHKNAVEKYKALASFLEGCGIEADIYPQGSFAFGTVVRPSCKDSDSLPVSSAKELKMPLKAATVMAENSQNGANALL